LNSWSGRFPLKGKKELEKRLEQRWNQEGWIEAVGGLAELAPIIAESIEHGAKSIGQGVEEPNE
jgi:hypothetical protein